MKIFLTIILAAISIVFGLIIYVLIGELVFCIHWGYYNGCKKKHRSIDDWEFSVDDDLVIKQLKNPDFLKYEYALHYIFWPLYVIYWLLRWLPVYIWKGLVFLFETIVYFFARLFKI